MKAEKNSSSAQGSSLGRGFDRLAGIYDLLGRLLFAGALQHSQQFFLKDLPSCKRILVVGGGTGTFLKVLLKLQPQAEIYWLDISEGMLKQAARATGPENKERVHFIHGDIRVKDLPPDIDLLCTNYLLDAFQQEELEFICQKLFEALTDKGLWLFTDFKLPKKNPVMRIYGRMILSALYGFFRLVCGIDAYELPDFDSCFGELKLHDLEEKEFFGGLMQSRLMQKPASENT